MHAAGHLDWLEAWVRKLDWQGILTLMDFNISGGLLEGRRLVNFFRQRFNDEGIEKLSMPFACVATELQTGREVWLNEGSVIDAVRASIALPGLFTPAQYEGHVLVDGGLVNPVPVSLCRAMGADVVIAVDLNWDLIGRRASASPSRLNESMDLHAEPPAKTGFRRVVRRRAQRITDGGSDRSNSQSFDAERAHHQPQHHAGAHHAEPPGGRSRRCGDPSSARRDWCHGLRPRSRSN